jgi:hypothetical protein
MLRIGTAWSVPALVGVLAWTLAAGCRRAPDPLDRIAALAATNRPAAMVELVGAINAKRVTFDSALNRAHEKLEAGEDAAAFAGAVLDASLRLEDRFNNGAEFEIFWRRVGRLAFRGALAAMQRGRAQEARTLVLNGPDRWKNEPYWIANPDHDALASVVLSATGERAEAIRRLQERTVLDAEAADALAALQRGR